MNEQAKLEYFTRIAHWKQGVVLWTYYESVVRGVDDPIVLLLNLGDHNAWVIGNFVDPERIAMLIEDAPRCSEPPFLPVGLPRRGAIRLLSELTTIGASSIEGLDPGEGYLLLIVDQGHLGLIKMVVPDGLLDEPRSPAASNSRAAINREKLRR